MPQWCKIRRLGQSFGLVSKGEQVFATWKSIPGSEDCVAHQARAFKTSESVQGHRLAAW